MIKRLLFWNDPVYSRVEGSVEVEEYHASFVVLKELAMVLME